MVRYPPRTLAQIRLGEEVEYIVTTSRDLSMIEHHGNGEHPELQERRRQLLMWRSLAVFIVVGALLGMVRLVRDLLADVPLRSLVYQVVLLVVSGLLMILVVKRIRSLRQRLTLLDQSDDGGG
jgi:hypothetical protein